MNNEEVGRDTEMLPMYDGVFPEKLSLAMAYVPMQRFENIYDADKGFEVGTIFKGLDLPFKGGRR